ncbi:MAG TPA: DUF5666 domain-containing protein [Candidatus Dormibacteraeota bacterium]
MINRFLPLLAAAAFVLAACGSPASAAKTSPSPSGNNAFRNGASGQLVQVTGQTLIITGPSGDTTVTVTATTTYTKTSIATLADIIKGTCILANGQKDLTSGAITATNVRISPKASAGCAIPGFGPGANPGATPPAGATPRPTPSGQANMAFVTGEVTAVSGPAVTVKTAASGTQTFTVASAATITATAEVTAAALQNGQCLRANGTRDAAGNVQATSITITPAGPSGTCATGGGGRGFGGGNRPGGSTATPGG